MLGTLQAHPEKLSKQQRRVLEAVTTLATDALTIPVDDAAAARIDPRASASSRPRTDRRAGGDITVSGGTVDEQIIALEHIRNARNVMCAHAFALLRPLTVSFLNVDKVTRARRSTPTSPTTTCRQAIADL